MGLQLEGMAACKMRDELWILVHAGELKRSEITSRMTKVDLPQWLRAQIIVMCTHNQYKRCTDPVEQAMHQAVCNKIVKELMDKEKEESC